MLQSNSRYAHLGTVRDGANMLHGQEGHDEQGFSWPKSDVDWLDEVRVVASAHRQNSAVYLNSTVIGPHLTG